MDPRFEIQTNAHLLADWRGSSSQGALTHAEAMRLRAIASVTRRDQFLAGRWLAKKMLAEAQGGSPGDWSISAEGHAKPVVVGHDLHLSISHSGPFVACCIADHAVGIDVEKTDRARPLADMATLVCSGLEQIALRALNGDALTQHFFQLWTGKEARLKQLDLPFGMDALRTIHMAPAEKTEADLGTWYFMGQHQVMLSLAARSVGRARARWPADWVVGPAQWHRYI